MSRRPLLLTRPWLMGALAALVAMAVCILLGMWQFSKYETKSANKERVVAHYSADPVSLGQVLTSRETVLPRTEEWATVEARGHYCTEADCVLYVRNRTVDGDVGFLQLVPFVTDEGTILVVRGYVPEQDEKSDPADPPAPPSGTETITLHLRPVEPALTDRSAPPGQVQSIAPAQVAQKLPAGMPLFTGAYGEMASEHPAASRNPKALDKPDISLGPHLSYAVQWWAFAAFFPIAWVVRGRQAVRDERLAEQDDAFGSPSGEGAAIADGGSDGASGQPADGPAAPASAGEPGRDPRHGQRDRTSTRRPSQQIPSRRRRARSRDEMEEDDYVDRIYR